MPFAVAMLILTYDLFPGMIDRKVLSQVTRPCWTCIYCPLPSLIDLWRTDLQLPGESLQIACLYYLALPLLLFLLIS